MQTTLRRVGISGVLSTLLLLVPTYPASALEAPAPFEVSEYSKDFGVPAKVAEERLETQQRGVAIVAELKLTLGKDYAGAWYDNEAGEFIIPVLTSADRATLAAKLDAKGLGGKYRTVHAASSWQDLKAAAARVNGALNTQIESGLAQTSIDPRSNAVVIRQSTRASQAQRQLAQQLVGMQGVAIDVRESDERLSLTPRACRTVAPRACGRPLRGGVALTPEVENGQVQMGECSTAFKATGNVYGNRFVLTAGHCGYFYPGNWDSQDANQTFHKIGPISYTFPGGDWAQINATGSEYWDWNPWPSQVAVYNENLERAINYEAYSYLGEYVCLSGNQSGTSCGTVSAIEVSSEDTITGKTIEHLTAFHYGCIFGGDSGGAIFTGETALGIFSSSDIGGCSATGYYEEITRADDAMGVRVGYRIGGAPFATTNQASNVRDTQATLNADINPNSVETTYKFEYGKTASYGASVPVPSASAGHGVGPVGVNFGLTGLEAGTTYHYRVVAVSAAGTGYGGDVQFTTRPARTAAYQGPGGELWVSSLPSSATNLHLGMGTAGSQADIAALAGGDYEIAFRSNGNELFTYSPVRGTTNTHLAMMPGSTPSVTALVGGGYVIAFQSSAGGLSIYTSGGAVTNLPIGMGLSPSSPSIAGLHNGSFIVAFRAYGNILYVYSPETGAVNLQQSMIGGASPSVTVLPSGFCEVAYQNATGELSTYNPTVGITNLKLNMGTKPSTPDIATVTDGTRVIAFRSSEGELWTWASNGGARNLHLGMGATPTAPSITETGSNGYEIAFKAYGEELMTYSPSTGPTPTGLSMWQGSSPSVTLLGGKVRAAYQGPGGELWVSSLPSSAQDLHLGMGTKASRPDIAGLAGGSYAIAFRSNGNELFTYSPISGTTNTHLWMMPGSTPSIAALAGGGYVVAFQSNEGALWTYRSNGVATNLNMGMGYSASSPSVAPLPNGNFVIALRSYGNLLAVYSPETGGVNLYQQMIAGASPSVTVLPSGYCEVAYQNAAGELSAYTPTSGVTNLKLGMGTEPSTPDIATLGDGSWVIAFRSNEGALWTYASNGGPRNLNLGMGFTPTAPSITATGGSGYEMAFKAYGEELMTYSPSTGPTPTGLSMWQGSSPSIVG